jgi:hypothetical protein
MRFTVLTSLAILLSAGYASAADTDSGTAGRPSAVLSNSECLAVWHASAGNEFSRFHTGKHALSPESAKGIVTNFQQSDTDNDGNVSQTEFVQACKLGFVNASASAEPRVAHEGY